jgi:alkylation response protein AidB-like acyl-CoA dehydrogenase
MALLLTEDQQLLRDSARDFLGRRSPLSRHRELRDGGEATGFDRELWAEMADMGWPAINIPEAHGGLGFGYTGLGILLEESGRTLAASPLLSTALMGVTALSGSGNAALCEAWLPGVAAGQRLLAIANGEGDHHHEAPTRVTAERDGDGFTLEGEKRYVLDGHVADGLVVSARTEDGVSLFLLESLTAGIEKQPVALLDNRGGAHIRFDGVRLEQVSLIGPYGGGMPLLQRTLDAGRIGASAELLGIAREVFQRTVEYLKERKQFGVPIGSFQALQHRAAVLFGELELCRSVVLRALQALDADDSEVSMFASLAKARCGAIARLATAEAIQMHGGIGMTDQFDLGFFIKRCKALEQILGDTNHHLERFACLRGY